MAKNQAPRFTINGNVSANDSTTMVAGAVTATGDYTGASANHVLAFTANSTNGSRLLGLHFEATGTNTQSVARIYLNNGSTNTSASNNQLIGKLTLPATTASNTVAEASADYYFPGPNGIDLPPGFRIYVGLATTVATSWISNPIGGGNF